MKTKLLLALLCLSLHSLRAQDVPVPAPKQELPIYLRNAVIHVGNGTTIPRGDLLIVDGKLAEVGTVTQNFKNAVSMDLNGKHVWPGLIAPASQLGLMEIESVRATDDIGETGEINPNARALIAYNTDSRVIPTVRSNGVLLAQIAPKKGLIQGTSSVVQLDAWHWEDAAYRVDDALYFDWPSMSVTEAWWAPPADEQRKRITESLRQLDMALEEATAYAARKAAGNGDKPETDLRWEAMLPVVRGERPVFVRARTEKQIMAAVAFTAKWNLKMVLVGGADAHLCLEVLRARQIPVVVHQPHSLPRLDEDAIDMPYRLPSILQDAGILYCLSVEDFWQTRNLAFQAGTAAAHGLTQEQALQSVTLNAARILGIADRTGSLEAGKDANLLVTAGDLLDMRSSAVEHAWIQGRKIDLGNKQKDLYKKYMDHYGLGKK